MRKRYTEEQIRHYHELYAEKQISLRKFCKQNNLSYDALYKNFKRIGLKITPQSITRRKYPIDENFFDSIDNEANAYFLGLLYADGCNMPDKNRIEVSLKAADKDIVIELSKHILYGRNGVKFYERNAGYGMTTTAQLIITNKRISESLVKHGCGPRKTFSLSFPNWIHNRLVNHFVRGYFDGDGCLAIYQRVINKGVINKGRTKSGTGNLYRNAEFNIVGTKSFLKGLGQWLEIINVPFSTTKRHKDRNTPTRTLRVHGNKNIRKVTDWLYKDATIFLQRKHNIYQELCSITKPQLEAPCAI